MRLRERPRKGVHGCRREQGEGLVVNGSRALACALEVAAGATVCGATHGLWGQELGTGFVVERLRMMNTPLWCDVRGSLLVPGAGREGKEKCPSPWWIKPAVGSQIMLKGRQQGLQRLDFYMSKVYFVVLDFLVCLFLRKGLTL